MDKLYNKIRTFLLLSLCCVCLCSCQETPPKDIVVNETANLSIENNAGQSTGNHQKDDTSVIHIDKSFQSTDGSVQFQFNVEVDPAPAEMSTVVVTPHYLTEEDARRTAFALFGDVDFFEREPYQSVTYSKAEVQERISKWSQYANADALSELYGTNDNSFILELIKDYIYDYTQKLETAPISNPHLPCKWTFKESLLYSFEPEDLSSQELKNDNVAIMSNCAINGISYCFDAVTRNRLDYKLNVMAAYIDSSNSPFGIDDAISRSKLCRTAKPSQTQVDALKERALSILDQIDLGEWSIDSCTLEESIIGDQVEYSIQVNAVPLLGGVNAVDCAPFLKQKDENVYSSNYYLTSAQFEFAPDGTLLSFDLTSPVDITEIGESIKNVSSADSLISRVMEVLSLTDFYAFCSNIPEQYEKMPLTCNVEIERAYYGLVRTKVANEDNLYQYVPSFVVIGTMSVSNSETGDLYMVKGEPGIILALNAQNGAILIAPGL